MLTGRGSWRTAGVLVLSLAAGAFALAATGSAGAGIVGVVVFYGVAQLALRVTGHSR